MITILLGNVELSQGGHGPYGENKRIHIVSRTQWETRDIGSILL